MDIEELKTLKLEPGSVLVVKVGAIIDKETTQLVRAHFVEAVPALKGRILVIGSSVTLSALKVL